MTVRPATPADAGSIAEVHVAASQRRLSQPRSANLVVADDQKSLAGFCLFGPTRDEDGKDKPIGEIIALNVRPDYWRRGVGKALCDSALSEAPRRGWTVMTLWILKGNARAGGFYEALGFGLDGTERLDTHVIGAPVYELRYRKAIAG